MRIAKLWSLILILSLGACSFKKDEAKQQEAAKATAEVLTQHERNQKEKRQSEEDGGKLTDQNVSVTFTENPQPGSYRMRITWPESVVAMTVQVNDSFEVTTLKNNFYEVAVIHNTEYRVRLYSKTSDGIEVDRKEIVTKSPRDFVFDKNATLSENTTLEGNRLYFYPQGRIITNGYDLKLVAKKIFVLRDGKLAENLGGNFWSDVNILTTPLNTIASEATQLQGSKISITASEAHGHLKVALIGMHGKNGRNGDDLNRERGLLPTQNPSLNGKNGEAGILKTESIPCTVRKGMDTPCDKDRLICTKAPTQGSDGLPGATGTPGEDGQRGGDTGSLFIDIASSADFSVEVGQLVGQPGRGGVGGRGSPGGLGGKAGQNPGHPCPSAQDGKNGPEGHQGPNGKTGPEGKNGAIETGSTRTKIFAL